MFDFIILIADRGAVSFCHYSNEYYYRGESDIISVKNLEAIVKYSLKYKLILNVLVGKKLLPKDLVKILKKAKHVKITTYELIDDYPDAVPVFDFENDIRCVFSPENTYENIIIRIPGDKLFDLQNIIKPFIDKTKRINLVISKIENIKEKNLIEYEHQLRKVISDIMHRYLQGKSVELNFLSDRLLLKNMNNCDAGLRHVTFAPNGKFYLCPAFYYNKEDNYIGSIKEGINIPNEELLLLNHSPICCSCDAYHCKRCIYLNKLMTREINTPSYEQCVLSHLERNSSRSLMRRLNSSVQHTDGISDIPEIDYLDPFDKLKEKISYNKIELYQICKGDI